jgi:uncharacterized protein
VGDHFFDVAAALVLLAGSKPTAVGGVVFMTSSLILRIVVMAKAPVAGFAKTRLIPALGAEVAADLAKRMLRRTLETALASKLGPVEICATPDPTDPVWQNLDLPCHVSWSAQGDGDLGDRMARTAARTTRNGEAILLIGTDCPAIDISTLHEAAKALIQQDACLIPAFDGGYVLLGLKQFDARLFDNMLWSTRTVAQEMLKRMQRLGWQTTVLPTLHDIDESVDLQFLPTEWDYLNPAT